MTQRERGLGTCELANGDKPHLRMPACNNWQPLAASTPPPSANVDTFTMTNLETAEPGLRERARKYVEGSTQYVGCDLILSDFARQELRRALEIVENSYNSKEAGKAIRKLLE